MTTRGDGLTPVATTEAIEGSPIVDVIFIHGINASAGTNWIKDGHEWIVDDLPKDVKGANIMTFGYNSKVLSDATFGRIRDFAKQLLEAILAYRGPAAESPIVYVCHSMGGLVLKQAMVLAKNDARYGKIHQCSTGIIFLATPHRGSGKAALAEIIVNITKVSLKRPKTELLKQLEKDNQDLQDLSDDFRGQHSHFKIASFFELMDTDIGFFSPKIRIVSPESAKMDIEGEIQLPVSSDHRQICKFASSSDSGYKSIMSIVKEFAVEAPAIVDARLRGARRERILRMMADITPEGVQLPQGMLAALSSQRVQGTCEWILQTPLVQQFLDEKNEPKHLLCFGKAGSGKTHLSSKVIEELQRTHQKEKDATVIYFFCSRNSNEPGLNSNKAILTSLLCQILLDNLHQQDEFIDLVQTAIPQLRDTRSGPKNITIDQIEEGIHTLILRLRRCWLVIDAIDESDDPFNLIQTLSRLLNAESGMSTDRESPIKVLTFARQEYELGTTFDSNNSAIKFLFINPEMISQDISLYIEKQIEVFTTRVPKRLRAEEVLDALRTVLTQKADGMFLWVRMMVADLIEQAEEPTEIFVQCLRQAPSGLNGIYEQYCERLATRLTQSTTAKNSQLKRAQRCLKWLAAWHVVELGQLGLALSSQPPQEDFTLLENFQDGIEGPLLKSLGSLIEIRTVERSSLVQFDDSADEVQGTVQVASLVHDSLRLFLLNWRPTTLSNICLLLFDSEEAFLEVAISCLSYLTSNSHARRYSSLDYDPKTLESRFLILAGRTWVEFASCSGGAGAMSLKLLKLLSLYLVMSCETALSALDGLPCELPELALEKQDFLCQIDIRNFADCILMLAEAISNAMPNLPDVESQVVELSQRLSLPTITKFRCKAKHIVEGRRILSSMRAQGIPLKYYDLVSMFHLEESSSKLQIPLRACEYGLKEIQAQFLGLESITHIVKFFKSVSDPLHLCAVEANQSAIAEQYHSRFLVSQLTAPYRTAELFMGLAGLRNLPSTTFHDWELYRRPRRDGYNMKYSNMAYESLPRKLETLNGDFLGKALSHSGRVPSEMIAYFEKFPWSSAGIMMFRTLGFVKEIALIVCVSTGVWLYCRTEGDSTKAIANIISVLPARLFPLDPSASKGKRVVITTLVTSTRSVLSRLSWMDLLRVLLTGEALRNYQRRLQLAWQVDDLRFSRGVLEIFPEMLKPGMAPPELSILPPLASQSFATRCLRLIEPCVYLLAEHFVASWLLDLFFYLGLYRVGYALLVEDKTLYGSITRSWISVLALTTNQATQISGLPVSFEPPIYSAALFLCFMVYDFSTGNTNWIRVLRGNVLFLLPGIWIIWDYCTMDSQTNFWYTLYASILLIFAIDTVQGFMLDPSGVLEAVSSLLSGRYLVAITGAKKALEVQKTRLRTELGELFRDES